MLYTSLVIFLHLSKDAEKLSNHSSGSAPMYFDALSENFAALIENSSSGNSKEMFSRDVTHISFK